MSTANTQVECIQQDMPVIAKIVHDQPSPFIANLNRQVEELKQQGQKIVKLSGGDPPHMPAELRGIIAELGQSNANHWVKYSPIAGFNKLREKLAIFYQEQYQRHLTQDQIMICSGGCSGLFLSLKTILNPMDQVLIPDPCWEYLPRLIENCGAIPRFLKFQKLSGIQVDWSILITEIEKQLKNGIRVVVMNFPLNPTGIVAPLDIVEDIVKLCEHYRAWYLSDDVTIDFKYQQDTNNFLRFNRYRNYIAVHSFSKNFGLTGFRFGFVVADELFIQQLSKTQLYTFMYPSSLSQEAIYHYLNLGKNIYNDFIEKIATELKNKIHQTCLLLSHIAALEVTEPDGGLFVFPKVREPYQLDYEKLLRQYNVAVAPGIAFGEESRQHFRVFAGGDFEQMKIAVAAISDYF